MNIYKIIGNEKITYGIILTVLTYFFLLQDYCTATKTFQLNSGNFYNSYLYHIDHTNIFLINFLFVLLPPLFLFYIPARSALLSKHIELNDYYAPRKILGKFLLWIMVFAFYAWFLNSKVDSSFSKFLNQNIYIAVVVLTYILSKINSYLYFYENKRRQKILFYFVLILIFVFLISLSKELMLVSFMNLYLYFIGKIFYPQKLVKTSRFYFKSEIFLIVIFFLSSTIAYINYDTWTSKKLSDKDFTLSNINKGNLLRNEKNLKINDSEIESLNGLTIPKSTINNEVYFLPISKTMQWYFVDENTSLKKEHNITIYGVEIDRENKLNILHFKSTFKIHTDK